jgi:hypothetical protein
VIDVGRLRLKISLLDLGQPMHGWQITAGDLIQIELALAMD